jgi:uncharacterized protein (TIRG00374 family)
MDTLTDLPTPASTSVGSRLSVDVAASDGGTLPQDAGASLSATPMDRTGSASRRRRGTAVAKPVLRSILAAAGVALLVRLVLTGWPEIREAATVLLTSQLQLVAMVIALEVLWTLSLAQLLRNAVLAVGGSVDARQALRISMAGFALSRIVPGGGAAGGVFATRELVVLRNALATALGAMVVSWAVATTSLASLVLVGGTIAAATDELPLAYLIPSALALTALVGVAGLVMSLLRNRTVRLRVLGGLERLGRRVGADRHVRSVGASLDTVADRLTGRRRLAVAAAWSVTAWLADAAALWLVFAAFGHRLTLAQLVVGYTFANLLNSAPELTPGWIGVFEATAAAAYAALGVPAGIAVVAVISYRLVSFWLPVAAGVGPAVFSLKLGRAASGTEPRSDAATSTTGQIPTLTLQEVSR